MKKSLVSMFSRCAMRSVAIAAFAAPFVASAIEIDLNKVKGIDLWGGRPAHPAVVNPVTGEDAANVISLRGEWEFQTRWTMGKNNAWGEYNYLTEENPWPTKIAVPACWEAQGIGKPMDMSNSWDVKGDHNPKPIRHAHMGIGAYRKRVVIPEAWRGKRIWLKVGGAKSIGWFLVNGTAAACVDNFCGTYKYDITDLVTPGKEAIVAAQVRNDVPSRKGLLSAMHRWGGLYRDVELEATPKEGFIDDAWVRGNFDRGEAEAHVAVAGGEGMKVRFTVEGQAAETPVRAGAEEQVVRLALKGFRAWSTESPNLYTGLVELVTKDGRILHSRRERFGIRKLEVRGKDLYLNNKPFYVRGFGDDHVYPMTGITPPDVNEHRRHLGLARKAGFNFVRLHTHTELPEYYEAADEMGILVEAEMPYYNDQPTEGQSFDPVRDVTELWKHFRRYPSFAVYSMGNEGTFGPGLDKALHDYVKKMDPDRLKINQDCHEPRINPPESADFMGGPIKIWARGTFNPERPFVTHEYMNLGAKTDARLENRFTGIWQPPVPRAKRNAWLAKFGLDQEWGDALQDAQHALQRVWQKRGIECARTDPYCDGFCYWTIVDVTVENRDTYSAQGMFNAFWEQKSRGYSAEEVRVFNSAAGVFADLGNKVYATGDKVSAELRFADYGERPFTAATLVWQVREGKRVLAEGQMPMGDLAYGAVRQVGTLAFAAPAVEKAVKTELRLTMKGAAGAVAENTYDLWLFPKRERKSGRGIAVADCFAKELAERYEGLLPEAQAAEAEIVIAPYGSPLAAEALAHGQKVITLAQCGGHPNVELGWWFMGSQVGTAFRAHPALAALPHEGILNELFFRIIKQGRRLPLLKNLAKDDLIVVGEGGDACYLYLGQSRIAKGKALLAFGLDVLSDTPEGAALLDGFIAYVRSAAFAPKSVQDSMPKIASLNGWARTLKAGDRATWPGPVGDMHNAIARGLPGMTELTWETQRVPGDVRKNATYSFRFFGGQGYLAQPPVAFELFVNGRKAIDIPAVTLESKTWKQGAFTLAYERERTTEEYGTYTLTVPSDVLVPGERAVLSVTTRAANSRQWFAVQENPPFLDKERPASPSPAQPPKTAYTAGLYAQIPMEMLCDANREQYLKDAQDAGLEAILLSFGDLYARGEERKQFFARLASEIKFFEQKGFAVLVWTDTMGYGGQSRTKTADGAAWFGKAEPLRYLTGQSCHAYCPLDPDMRRYMLELTKDIARAGAKFFMVDDDYVQSARGHLGCCCKRHLEKVAARLGRTVTPQEIWASFSGKPNAVRSAFIDANGEAAIETARLVRKAADEVNPGMGIGLCLSYTHWDIEGADMDELLGAFAGPRHQKLVRTSGAPYWWDGRYHGVGLEGIIEFVRKQNEWTHGKGWAVLDENDPYPRQVAKIPAWRCELYDKATIADGLSARHKYMLCYGRDRQEPGYLNAHLADKPFDRPLRDLFANTEPYGVYVPFPVRQIREATLPTPAPREGEISELAAHPLGSAILLRSGIPVRHTPAENAFVFEAKDFGIDLWKTDFAKVRPDAYRGKILAAAKKAGKPLAVYVETGASRIYQLVRYNPAERSYSVLIENCGKEPADLRIVTKGTPKVLGVVHGAFEAQPGALVVRGFPAHDWAAVKFTCP